MATGSRPEGLLYGVYEEYVGEARTKPEVYGYWVLVAGVLAGVAAVVVLVLGGAVGLSPEGVREVGTTLAAIAGVGLLLGTVLQLPVRRRAVGVAVLGAVVSLFAVVGFVGLYPAGWRVGGDPLTLAVLLAYAGGLALVAVVAALVPVVTGRRSLLLAEEPAAELAWADGTDEPGREASAVVLGEATRDGLFAVFPSDRGWRWRFVEQTAVADSGCDYESQAAAERALDALRSKVDRATLLEVNHTAFRLYAGDGSAGGDGSASGVRWALVDDSGGVVADGGGPCRDRAAAERTVNLLKERGPTATLLGVGEGAFELYGGDGGWRWRLVDTDRTVLATGPERRDDRGETAAAMETVRNRIPDASTIDVEHVGFELRETGDGWRWRLVDAADVALVESSETFRTREAARASAHRVADGAVDAPFLQTDTPAYEVYDGPEEGWHWRLVVDGESVAGSESPLPSAESGRSVVDRVRAAMSEATPLEMADAEFEVYPEGDVWRWRLVTEARETVAASPRGVTYDSEAAAVEATERVSDVVAGAERMAFSSAAFHLYETGDGAWNWRLVDSDGSLVSDSGQEHDSREDAAAAMATLKEHAPGAELVEIETAALERYRADGEWHWRLVDDTGETLATSPGRYESESAADDAIDTLETLVREADCRVMSRAGLQAYVGTVDGTRRWRWRLVHPDGTVLARSADGFPDADRAVAAAESVAADAGDAPVHTLSDVAIRFSVDRSDSDPDPDATARPGPDGEAGSGPVPDGGSGPDADTGSGRRPAAESGRDPAVESSPDAGAGSGPDATADGPADQPGNGDDPAAGGRDGDGDGDEDRDGGAGGELADRDDGRGATETWSWEIIDSERTTLATGLETFEHRDGVAGRARLVRDHAGGATVFAVDPAAFRVRETDDGWEWDLVEPDRTVLATGVGTYGDAESVRAAVARVRDLAPAAASAAFETAAFEVVETGGRWRWRFVDVTGATLARSTTTFASAAAAETALADVRDRLAEASVVDVGAPAFELHREAGEWRWRLLDTDGTTVAEGIETHPTRREARRALSRLRDEGSDAVTDVAV